MLLKQHNKGGTEKGRMEKILNAKDLLLDFTSKSPIKNISRWLHSKFLQGLIKMFQPWSENSNLFSFIKKYIKKTKSNKGGQHN